MSSPGKKSGKSPSRDESPSKAKSLLGSIRRTGSQIFHPSPKKRDAFDAHGEPERGRTTALWPQFGQFDQEEPGGSTPASSVEQPRRERASNFRGFHDPEKQTVKRERPGTQDSADESL